MKREKIRREGGRKVNKISNPKGKTMQNIR